MVGDSPTALDAIRRAGSPRSADCVLCRLLATRGEYADGRDRCAMMLDMSARTLLEGLTWVLYLLLGAVTVRAAILRPRRFLIDTALFFAVVAVIILASALNALLQTPLAALGSITEILLMTLPYLLLRLIDGFTNVPSWVMTGSLLGLALSIAALVLMRTPTPTPIILLLVLYFVGLGFYATMLVVREARRATGVTQRRLDAVAGGSLMLALTIMVAGLGQFLPPQRGFWSAVGLILGLLSGLFYYLGFSPPAVLRRAWQEPELRDFLADAAQLPLLVETTAILRALERGAAAALGVTTASIGIWNEQRQRLAFVDLGDGTVEVPSGEMLAGRAFAQQQSIFSADATRDDPAHAASYLSAKAKAILAAPITAGEQRLGVLVAYAAQPPVFAEDDLALVQLLARQAAVILDYIRLYDASKLRAQEMEALYAATKQAEREREQLLQEQTARAEAEAAVRARDEFLFLAAHELRTPITSLHGFVQVLLRQIDRRGDVDRSRLSEALRTIEQQSNKMVELIAQLLDVSRLSTGKFLLERRVTDVTELVRSVVAAAQVRTSAHSLQVTATGPCLASIDPLRFEQVVVNLVDNAIRYSPDGGGIQVEVGPAAGERAQLTVRDHGIGIPPEKREHIFDRFYQAHAGDYYGGLGLGLYITREIVELHGGSVEASYPADGGVAFTVTLPSATAAMAADNQISR
jgi:signal transduction histidine kinase